MKAIGGSGFFAFARIVPLVAALCLAACATKQVRVDQFAAFAATGTAFTHSVDPVLTESFDASAKANALVLLQTRDDLSPTDRLSALQQADDDLNTRLAILADLKRHLGVLQSYFDALASLAATNAESSGMTAVAQGLFDSLGKLDGRIASASIAGQSIDSLIAPAAEFLFVSHQSRVLNRELRQHATAVDREIRLQQAALQALAEVYASDLAVLAAKEYRDQVALPFAGPGALAADWAGTRASLLQGALASTSIAAAADATARLRSSFVALVENRLSHAGIAALQTDINNILTAIDKSRAARAADQPSAEPKP